MTTLLNVQVSARAAASTSRVLSELFAREWRRKHSGGRVIVRDLAMHPPPFVDAAWIGGAFLPPADRDTENLAAIRASDELVAELASADHILIATPMYNLSIPAALKAWIDHVVRVGVTLGPDNVGLLTGKKAAVILASGGDLSPNSPFARFDHASGYLRAVLAWIGIDDVEMLHANRARAGIRGETAIEAFGASVTAMAEAF